MRGVAGVMVPFGAAASPDLTVLRVFLAVVAGTAVGSLIAFAAVTITTIVALTPLATAGGDELRATGCTAASITAATLPAIGTVVLTGTI